MTKLKRNIKQKTTNNKRFIKNKTKKIHKKRIKKNIEKNTKKNIEKRIKKRIKKIKGGSIIYDDGNIEETSETYNGKHFFRKIFYYSNPPTENQINSAKAEIEIVRIIMENPHPNIATYYSVNEQFVDMELLDTDTPKNNEKMITTMSGVKDFLQNLGIMYIDWKKDNIGVDASGNYKLFDFDCSGIINLKNNQWIIKPFEAWSYNNAISKGCKTPQQIDNWSFDKNILKK